MTQKHRAAHKIRVKLTDYPPDLYTAVTIEIMREDNDRAFAIVPGRVVALPNRIQLAQGFRFLFVEVAGGKDDLELTWNARHGAAIGRLGAQTKRR